MIIPTFLLLVAPALTLRADQQGLTLLADTGPVATLAYLADGGEGRQFSSGATRLEDGALTVTLAGSAAAESSLSGQATSLARGVRVDWRIAAPAASWSGGWRHTYAGTATSAASRPVTAWVTPTGAQPWEVAGDTPYPDTACQVRVVRFGEQALVMVCSSYDPDWFYARNLAATRTIRFAPPSEGGERRATVTWLWVPAAETDPLDAACADRFAAEAESRPLALTVDTGRQGNLFAPGETVPLRLRVGNVTDTAQRGAVEVAAYDYAGRELLNESLEVTVPPRGTEVVTSELRPGGRGVVFVKTGVSWAGGRFDTRATIGVVDERQPGPPRPESPFGMAAIIAAPERYPDQLPDAAVLQSMARIGVRWIRSGFYQLADAPTVEQRQATAARLAELRSFGILPHVHAGTPVPDDAAAFEQRLAATIGHFGDLATILEVGNELNLGGLSAENYIAKILRPAAAATRRLAPGTEVFSMGLGGVNKPWLDAFEAAGGMELVDVLSVHPGCHPKAPEFWEGWRGWVWRSQMLDAMAAAKRAGKRVWISEAYAPTPPGRNGLDVRTAADYLVRTYLCSLALGVQVCEWYQFQDGTWFGQRNRPDDIEYSFGIVYPDLTPKPGYAAFGAMTAQLEGARCLGRLDLGADDLYGLRFQRADGPVDVLWSYREKHECDLAWYPPEKFKDQHRRPLEPWVERWRAPVTVALPAPGDVTVTDLMGNPTTVGSAGGQVSLALSGSPRYVTGLGELALAAEFWPPIPN